MLGGAAPSTPFPAPRRVFPVRGAEEITFSSPRGCPCPQEERAGIQLPSSPTAQGQPTVDLPWQSRAGKLLVPGETSRVSAPVAFVSSRLTSAFSRGSCSTCSQPFPASPKAASGFLLLCLQKTSGRGRNMSGTDTPRATENWNNTERGSLFIQSPGSPAVTPSMGRHPAAALRGPGASQL